MVLGSEYAGAGFTTHTEYDNGDTAAVNITYGSGVTTAQTYAVKTSSTTLSATGMTGALTLTAIEADITSADTFTGGSGSDTLTMTFSGTAASSGDIGNVTSIETYKSASNQIGGFTFADANFVSNNFSVDATANTSAAFTVDASAEDDSTMTYTGGAGVDTVTGTATTATGDTITAGAGADIITGAGGGDTITGGAGADVFTYTAVAHSTGTARDTISDFTSGTDSFHFTIDQSSQTNAVTIDATVQTARAGTSAVQANLSGSIGQAIYDTFAGIASFTSKEYSK
jgi:Ca2+-binding RTX toxin-like protein